MKVARCAALRRQRLRLPHDGENVVSAANTTNRTTLAEMQRLIADAGYTPKQRKQDYTILEDAA